MESQEDIDLGINPAHLNPTEERLIALIFELRKYPNGLTTGKIKKILSRFYDPKLQDESLTRKIHRDITILQEMGFLIQHFTTEDGKDKTYKLIIPVESSKIQFTKEELGTLSVIFSQENLQEITHELFTAFQKIFHKNMDFFPFQNRPKDFQNEEERAKVFQILLTAIRSKTPLKITYFKNFPEQKEEREIDPIHVTKRNHADVYLIAYDRKAKMKKRFFIPKILKCQEISSSFIKNHTITEDDKNYHALAFPVHETLEVTIETNPENSWKLENFLEPHPFSKEENIYKLKTTNRKPLIQFMWRHKNVITKIYPESLIAEYKEFLKKLADLYKD
ncbi:MAG: WYL domain-containing protein [Leptospiraceae bacterium]|nr:WYL domain-containing protein [Leptospiraceae bacterium]